MSGEKQHPPSARRLREARREGRIAFSPEPAGAAALIALALLLPLGGSGGEVISLTSHLLGSKLEVGEALTLTLATLAWTVLPWLGLVAALGLASGLIQTRGLIAFHSLRPDLGRLSLDRGVKKLFGLDRLAAPIRGLLLTLVGLPLFAVVAWGLLPGLIQICGRARGIRWVPELLSPILWTGAGLLVVSAAADLFWRRHRHGRSLRMSDQERKDEARQESGEPQARQQRRGLHRQLALSSPPPVGEAKVLVLNPTRLAVALHHDHLDALPYLGITATGRPAGRVRAEARRAGVPLLRDRTLARALIQLEPGAEIPASLYAPVATLLAGVYRSGLAQPPTRGAPR